MHSKHRKRISFFPHFHKCVISNKCEKSQFGKNVFYFLYLQILEYVLIFARQYDIICKMIIVMFNKNINRREKCINLFL